MFLVAQQNVLQIDIEVHLLTAIVDRKIHWIIQIKYLKSISPAARDRRISDEGPLMKDSFRTPNPSKMGILYPIGYKNEKDAQCSETDFWVHEIFFCAIPSFLKNGRFCILPL